MTVLFSEPALLRGIAVGMGLPAPRYLVVGMTHHHPNLGTLQLFSMILDIVKTIQKCILIQYVRIRRTHARKTQF